MIVMITFILGLVCVLNPGAVADFNGASEQATFFAGVGLIVVALIASRINRSEDDDL